MSEGQTMHYDPINIVRRMLCDHEWEHVRNIHGDEINLACGKRSWWRCKKCGKYELRPYLYMEVS